MPSKVTVSVNDIVNYKGTKYPVTAVTAPSLHPTKQHYEATATITPVTLLMTPENSVVASVDTLGRKTWIVVA